MCDLALLVQDELYFPAQYLSGTYAVTGPRLHGRRTRKDWRSPAL